MLKITLMVDSDNIIGVKETLNEYCEKCGDVTVINVEEIKGETKHENKTL